MKTLWPHQIENIQFIKETQKCLIADDTGMGKTLTAVAFLKEQQMTDFVIICPLAVVGQWYLTLQEEAGIEAKVLKGVKAPHVLPTGAYIIHYNVLHHWFKCLAGYHQAIIIDESQMIGNPKTKRTKCTMSLAHSSAYVVGFSATPFRTYPKQLWPMLNICSPALWRSAWTFYARYCGLKKGRFGLEYNGATNMNELREKTRGVMIAHKNNQEFRRIELWHLNDWVSSRDNDLKLLEGMSAAALVTKMAQMQAVNFEKKSKAIIDWVQIQEEPLILFYWHHTVGDFLKLTLKCPLFDGRTDHNERARILKHHPQILAMNLQSGGVGIDGLQHTYSNAAFVEFGYSPADIKQAIGRIARSGQKKPVKIYFHGALDTSDEIFLNRIQSRFGLLGKMFDNLSQSFLQNDLFNQNGGH
jgi:SWI/SNF-related matrix-associated actin-dependent regulator 1 of chromatin subfamily A